MHHSNSNRHALLGMSFPQCSCAFCHKICTGLFSHSFCYTSHGLATCTAFSFSTLLNLLSCASPFTEHAGSFCWCIFCGFVRCTTLFHSGHSLHLCSFSPHLKHSTSTTPTFLIILFSTLHCITLLFNTSNLFWGIVTPFSVSFCFLQFWARCLNPLQLKHNFPLLSSSSSLSLVRECFSLSKLLISTLYCCKDIVLRLCRGYRFNN